jgi:two-component system response regulator LytT
MNFYIFKSRVLTHILFWVLYYIFFGYIWAKDENYYVSYFLELILLPIRILSVYSMIYLLIPKFLKAGRYWEFAAGYVVMLMLCGLLQRIFTYYYYDSLLLNESTPLFNLVAIVKNIILINSTILFVSAIKITQLWRMEIEQNEALTKSSSNQVLKIKSDKRVHRISPSDILYVESLGNYVTYHLKNGKLISYESLNVVSDKLGNDFLRIHKSYIVNKSYVSSYNYEDVEIGSTKIPFGRAYRSSVHFEEK